MRSRADAQRQAAACCPQVSLLSCMCALRPRAAAVSSLLPAATSSQAPSSQARARSRSRGALCRLLPPTTSHSQPSAGRTRAPAAASGSSSCSSSSSSPSCVEPPPAKSSPLSCMGEDWGLEGRSVIVCLYMLIVMFGLGISSPLSCRGDSWGSSTAGLLGGAGRQPASNAKQHEHAWQGGAPAPGTAEPHRQAQPGSQAAREASGPAPTEPARLHLVQQSHTQPGNRLPDAAHQAGNKRAPGPGRAATRRSGSKRRRTPGPGLQLEGWGEGRVGFSRAAAGRRGGAAVARNGAVGGQGDAGGAGARGQQGSVPPAGAAVAASRTPTHGSSRVARPPPHLVSAACGPAALAQPP